MPVQNRKLKQVETKHQKSFDWFFLLLKIKGLVKINVLKCLDTIAKKILPYEI